MSKYILQFPKEIKPLEDNNQWLDAVALLYDQWKKNPMEEHNLVCLAMEAWYALLELDYLETARLLLEYYKCDPGIPLEIEAEQEKIHDILSEAMSFGLRKYSDSVLFNMYIGYAAKATPIHFVDFMEEWEKTAFSMIQKAYSKDDTDMLTKLFYYESIDRYAEGYTTASRNFWEKISISDWGDSDVQHHLFCMLDGDKYHRTD